MTRPSIFTALLIVLANSAQAAGTEVKFKAADGVTLFADLHLAYEDSKSAPTVLLFHQAGGDARGEYERITPRLLKRGYNVVAVDLRSGGDRFGTMNRTVAMLEDEEYGYCDAYPDLEAAVGLTQQLRLSGPVAAWGSSYSAALVFQLGARQPERVAAVLGFSPAAGGPMADCAPQPYARSLKIPALALRPQREHDIDAVREQLQAMADVGVQTYVADPGVHGSSMLDPDRSGGSTEATWQRVLSFLDQAFSAD